MRNLLVLLAYGSLAAAQSKMPLRENWSIQSSAEVRENGAALSAVGFAPRGWHGTTVPTTVFSALVKAGVYPDPYFGTNLRSVPA